ncbi:MAG TPA: xylulokinase [Planctomycetota bacterium]|nr:xylulokinase [Planctomycetota bacterium]
MPCLLGIDLGTQSVKSVVLDDQGQVRSVAQAEYPILTPRVGWAEQEPATWWRATSQTTQEAIAGARIAPEEIAGVGLSGQMHGTVCLDREGLPVRPAIIWADGRSAAEVDELVAELGRDHLARLTANPVAAGFMAATVRWLLRHEPETMARTATLVLPKDYIRLRLARHVGTDVTDAASTLLFDVAGRRWSDEMARAVGIRPDLLPRVHESHEVCGAVTRHAARDTGIPVHTPVVVGGGDQPVSAVGNGVIEPGTLLATIGTGGQLFAPLERPSYDPHLRTHTFCHAVPGRWFIMGAMLSAGLCLRWLRDQVFGGLGLDYAAFSEAAAQAEPGAEGLLFLPYLLGERTPHMDARARGVFFGLALRHERRHIVRAVMEGVAFALRDSLEIFRSIGVTSRQTLAAGGGARSAVWGQILADVLGTPLAPVEAAEPAACGAAILAGVGTGVFPSLEQGAARVARLGPTVEPIARNVAIYNERHAFFQSLYPRLKDAYRELSKL